MKKIKIFFTSTLSNIGIFYNEPENTRLPYDSQEYQLEGNEKKITAHRDFLNNLENQEDKRLDTIESKTSNLVAQTAIVFALLGLFIPLIMDKASELNVYVRYFLILILFLSSFFYLLTIHNALKNYQIHKFRYIRSLPSNVMDFKNDNLRKFIAEEVRDLLISVPRNRHINNRKGTNLLHSYNAFKLANFMTGILVSVFSVSILFYKPQQNTIFIANEIEIKNLDSLVKQNSQRNRMSDTIVLKLKDSIYIVPLQKKSTEKIKP